MSLLFVVTCIFLLGIFGFWCGRKRAIAFENQNIKMHSRPNYYGWWVFILTVFPALIFLGCWSFGSHIYLEYRALDEVVLAKKSLYQPLEPKLLKGLDQTTVKNDSKKTEDVGIDSPINHFLHNNSLVLSVIKALLRCPELLVNHNQSYQDLRKRFSKRGLVTPLEGETYMIAIADHWAKGQLHAKKIGIVFSGLVALLGFFLAYFQVKPRERARNKVETIIIFALGFSSFMAVLTTVGIVLSLIFETISFFHAVPLKNFLFGTVWDPRFSGAGAEHSVGQFGFLPLLAGTFYIAFVAMLFAVPVGLFSAIYMAEYAKKGTRAIVKPLLEVLAGIPTIVYGFFALITVGPFLRDLSIALVGGQGFIMAQSVLTAGLVMGILLIPFISSLADDIIKAIPHALREGSYGLGATRSETIKKVVLPAALPGVVGAILLAASRAIGETMIVVLAAGVAANLTLNPFESMTTITVKIVNQLTGDLEFNSPQTLVAFALGMTLFVLTLIMNIYAVYIVRKYREQYE